MAVEDLELSEHTRIATTDELRYERRGDRTLVVSPQTGGYQVIADRELLRLLRDLDDSGGHAELGELYEAWTGDKDLFLEQVQELFERGLLSLDRHSYGTSSSRPGRRGLQVISPRSADNDYPVLGVLHVHNYCNLACTYCYTIEEGVSREKLSVELMKKAVDELAELPTPATTLEFHGGEPTMAFPAIVEVVSYAAGLYARRGKPLSFSLQTNAYTLTPRIVAFLKEHDFKIRVSLDGTREMNDRFRLTRAGGGSYDRVLKGIRLLQEAGLSTHAVCVVHRYNVERMVEMYDSMAALGVTSIRFLPVFKSGNAGDEEWLDGSTYFNSYFEVVKHMVALGKRGEKVCPLPNLIAGELGSLGSFKREYMCMRGPCGAGTNMIAVDVNGDLYPCEEMIGKSEFVIGNLRTERIKDCLDRHALMHTLRNRHVDDIPECDECSWKQMCHGGCVHKSYTHFKRLDRKSEHCSYYKEIYRELIWLEDDQPGAWKLLQGS